MSGFLVRVHVSWWNRWPSSHVDVTSDLCGLLCGLLCGCACCVFFSHFASDGGELSEEAAALAEHKPARCHFASIDATQKPRAVAAQIQSAFVDSVLARHGSKVTKKRVVPQTTCSAFAITLFTLDDQ